MILPDPGPGFRWRQTNHGPGLVCRSLEDVATHLFTTRHWPLGRRALTDSESGPAWSDVADAMGTQPSGLLRARQVHGAAVVTAHPSFAVGLLSQGDILVADATVACAIQTADCVPLLLAIPRSGAVAAAHAGWRGLAQRVPQVAIAALISSSHAAVEEVLAVIGPSIGPCCYEVGDEVRAAFAAEFDIAKADGWFSSEARATLRNPSLPHLSATARRGHAYFDMWQVTRDQLIAAGVRPDRLYSSELCTASHTDAFCSYRRDGVGAGRMAAAIRGRG